jgi:hypothetical protein
MVGKFRDHLDLRNGLVENDAVNGFEVVADQIEKRLELLACLTNVF